MLLLKLENLLTNHLKITSWAKISPAECKIRRARSFRGAPHLIPRISRKLGVVLRNLDLALKRVSRASRAKKVSAAPIQKSSASPCTHFM